MRLYDAELSRSLDEVNLRVPSERFRAFAGRCMAPRDSLSSALGMQRLVNRTLRRISGPLRRARIGLHGIGGRCAGVRGALHGGSRDA